MGRNAVVLSQTELINMKRFVNSSNPCDFGKVETRHLDVDMIFAVFFVFLIPCLEREIEEVEWCKNIQVEEYNLR